MKIRTTFTISAAYNVQPHSGETDEQCLRRIEEEMHYDFTSKLSLHVAMAGGPDGTISWTVKPTNETFRDPNPPTVINEGQHKIEAPTS